MADMPAEDDIVAEMGDAGMRMTYDGRRARRDIEGICRARATTLAVLPASYPQSARPRKIE